MAISILSRKPQTKEINKVISIPLADIVSNPYQPRKHFDEHAIRELAESIRENGLLQPITVRKNSKGKFELVAGERRTLAFRLLRKIDIPAIVESFSDEQSSTLALIENLQRENLNYFEQAMAIANIMKDQKLTQNQVSVKLGMAQSTVANKLRLLQFEPQVHSALLDSNLTERHARAMLKIADSNCQLAVIDYVVKNGLNVDQTEKYIHSVLINGNKSKNKKLFIVKDMRLFINSLNKAVNTMRGAGISVDSQKSETDNYLEYVIRIPKNSVYKNI